MTRGLLCYKKSPFDEWEEKAMFRQALLAIANKHKGKSLAEAMLKTLWKKKIYC
ncbi:hypothetical protein ACWCL1_04960 [Ligilactobacillus sp. LYQ135]